MGVIGAAVGDNIVSVATDDGMTVELGEVHPLVVRQMSTITVGLYLSILIAIPFEYVHIPVIGKNSRTDFQTKGVMKIN